MKLSKLIAKYEAMRKILKTKDYYEAVIVLDEVIADLKYVKSRKKRK